MQKLWADARNLALPFLFHLRQKEREKWQTEKKHTNTYAVALFSLLHGFVLCYYFRITFFYDKQRRTEAIWSHSDSDGVRLRWAPGRYAH